MAGSKEQGQGQQTQVSQKRANLGHQNRFAVEKPGAAREIGTGLGFLASLGMTPQSFSLNARALG
jgi:hypothetical protein